MHERLMGELSAQPIRMFLDFNAVIVNLDSVPLKMQKSCVASIEKNVRDLKMYLEENLRNLRHDLLADMDKTTN